MRNAKETKTVTVKIMEKDVQIGCAAGDEADLIKAARYVDESMREFRSRSNTSTIEKIAIITAINTANELLKGRGESSSTTTSQSDEDAIQNKIDEMQARLDSVLAD